MKKAHFSRGLFGFLEELRGNNRREWFEANRARYERDVREPMLGFISDFAPRLRKISPKLVADPRPSGGSMFRIYRDVRFSPNKSPYKTHVAARFSHVMGATFMRRASTFIWSRAACSPRPASGIRIPRRWPGSATSW
jgi:uncharacterized protein (TIGR02453 family)